jgi:hypothetical protein
MFHSSFGILLAEIELLGKVLAVNRNFHFAFPAMTVNPRARGSQTRDAQQGNRNVDCTFAEQRVSMVYSAQSFHDRQPTTRIILELFELIGIDDVFSAACNQLLTPNAKLHSSLCML